MDVHEHKPNEESGDDGSHNLPYDIAALLRACFLGCLIRAIDRLYNGVDSSSHSTRNITGSKRRHDLMSDDLRRTDVGQDALQTIPDFDADFAFLYRHQEQDSVVGTLLTEFPCRGYAMGEFFGRFASEGGNDEDSHLIAGSCFMRRQLSCQRLNRGVRQDMGKINDPSSQGRDIERMCKKGEG
jgi:hypothetical protein